MRLIVGLVALLFLRPILYLLKGLLWWVLEFSFMIPCSQDHSR